MGENTIKANLDKELIPSEAEEACLNTARQCSLEYRDLGSYDKRGSLLLERAHPEAGYSDLNLTFNLQHFPRATFSFADYQPSKCFTFSKTKCYKNVKIIGFHYGIWKQCEKCSNEISTNMPGLFLNSSLIIGH